MKSITLATFLLLGILGSTTSMSQDNSALSDRNITTILNLFNIEDTVARDNASVTMKVLWMDSVLEIRKTTTLKYDLEYARKFRRDSTFIPTQKDTINSYELRSIGSQNCHSYALERYLKFHNISGNLLFTNRTVVTENMYMEKILTTSFKKTDSIKTKPKRNLKYAFDKGTLLVFRNKWNTPIHTVFYDGEYHSKYGAWAPKAEKELRPVFDKYWDTVTIEEYILDTSKVDNYLARHQK
jgi:hypothetical protein